MQGKLVAVFGVRIGRATCCGMLPYQYFLKDSTLLDEWLIHSMVLSVESVLRWMGFALV